eukprot:scaffold1660_cov92-Isochrysis_galbana.AAC.2
MNALCSVAALRLRCAVSAPNDAAAAAPRTRAVSLLPLSTLPTRYAADRPIARTTTRNNTRYTSHNSSDSGHGDMVARAKAMPAALTGGPRPQATTPFPGSALRRRARQPRRRSGLL